MEVLFAVRYDDCSARSPRGAERMLLDALSAHGLKATFAVIPRVADGDWYDVSGSGDRALGADLVDMLRGPAADGTVEIAQHGLTHRSRSPAAGIRANELAGLDAREQARRIGAGKALLEAAFGARVASFTAPWDSYDGATLEALASLGFEVFSQEGRGPLRPGRPVIVPLTCLLADAPRAVAAARAAMGATAVVAIVHPYDLAPAGPLGRGDLDRIFSRVAGSGVEAATLLDVGRDLERGWEARYLEYRRLRFSPAWRMAGEWTGERRRRAALHYGPAGASARAAVRFWAETAAAYAAGVAGGVAVGWEAGSATTAAPWVGGAIAAAAAVAAFHDGRPGFRGVWATAAACAFFAGSLAARV